jgi:hypothetical protein
MLEWFTYLGVVAEPDIVEVPPGLGVQPASGADPIEVAVVVCLSRPVGA